MSGTRTGRIKQIAERAGVTVEQYLGRRAAGEKWCTRCKTWHQLERFGVDRTRYDGLSPKCLSQRIYFPDEERRSRVRLRYRRYYAGPAGAVIRARVYARKRSMEPVSPHDRELVIEKFSGRCAYCGGPGETIDHVVPVSKGGRSRRGNLLPACVSCNSSKRTRDLDEFLSTIPELDEELTALIAEELCMAYVRS